MEAYHRADDLFVEVLLLDPPFAFGRQAKISHPLKGVCRVGVSELDFDVPAPVEPTQTFWLNASVKIVAKNEADAKQVLDRALRSECRNDGSGIIYFDRTGLHEEEDK